MRLEDGIITTEIAHRKKSWGKRFFCPLCRSERRMRVSSRLSWHNYLQIFITSFCLTTLLWPLMAAKGLFIFFPVWMLFELTRRMIFKKDIPCPHCGFDATWYKKDVKMARKIVEDFWQAKQKKDHAPAHLIQQMQQDIPTDAASRQEPLI